MKNIKLHEDTFDELDALRKESGLKWDDYVRKLIKKPRRIKTEYEHYDPDEKPKKGFTKAIKQEIFMFIYYSEYLSGDKTPVSNSIFKYTTKQEYDVLMNLYRVPDIEKWKATNEDIYNYMEDVFEFYKVFDAFPYLLEPLSERHKTQKQWHKTILNILNYSITKKELIKKSDGEYELKPKGFNEVVKPILEGMSISDPSKFEWVNTTPLLYSWMVTNVEEFAGSPKDYYFGLDTDIPELKKNPKRGMFRFGRSK